MIYDLQKMDDALKPVPLMALAIATEVVIFNGRRPLGIARSLVKNNSRTDRLLVRTGPRHHVFC